MTASIESNALREHYASMDSRLAANPDMDLAALRDMVEGLSYRQKEPTDVTYEEVSTGTRAAIWARPANATPGRVILYTHGGGYIGHTASTSRKLAGHLAKASRALALIPDYRVAPEAPFPSQLEDAIEAFDFLLNEGFDPSKMAIAGESAGGNLAAATVLKLRETARPLPGALIGFSPWFDLLGDTETFDTNAESDAFLSREISALMAGMFLGEHGSATDPLANPRFADTTGFPPTYLTAGSDETLLRSVEIFAENAKARGVDVTFEVAEGMQHAYQWMAGRAPEADKNLTEVGSWLERHLA